MHVGYAPLFQNPGNVLSDADVYIHELRLAERAEPLGFDSLWSVEHHFTDYTMCPDVLQFLSYMAGKTQRVKLGSMVVVVPWHDPVRVTEQVILLDHLSNGRLILGIGRGLARVEYEGFRLEQHQGRARFLEYAALILQGLEHGYIEGGRRCTSRAGPSARSPGSRSGDAPTLPPSRRNRCRSWRSLASAS